LFLNNPFQNKKLIPLKRALSIKAMVDGIGESLNQIFDELANWNDILKAG
jgi:hypothetical protein